MLMFIDLLLRWVSLAGDAFLPVNDPILICRAADNFNGAEATEAALRALLSAGADVAAANLRGATPLHWSGTCG